MDHLQAKEQAEYDRLKSATVYLIDLLNKSFSTCQFAVEVTVSGGLFILA